MKYKRLLAAATACALIFPAALLFGCTNDDTHEYSLKFSSREISLSAEVEAYQEAPFTVTAYCDGEEVPNAEIALSLSDPSLAEVKDGKLSALSAGKTELVATYKTARAALPVSVYKTATAEQILSFDEAYVNIYGRTYIKNKALNFDNVASGLEVAFLGTSLTMTATTEQDVFVHVYLDGDTTGEFKRLDAGEFTVAKDLEEGIHVAKIMKGSEVDRGKFAVTSLSAETFLVAQEKSDFKMEFIGDSITAGYGTLQQGGDWSLANSDGCTTYAYLTAQNLNADFSVVALSGICLNTNRYNILTMKQMHTLTSNRTGELWEYDAETDVVVLALGTNDASYITTIDPAYRSQFPKDYAEFLTHLREIYPHAYVVCIYGMMGANGDIVSGIQKALNTVNDDKMSYLEFKKNDAGAGGHPIASAHKSYSKTLTAYIQNLIG